MRGTGVWEASDMRLAEEQRFRIFLKGEILEVNF